MTRAPLLDGERCAGVLSRLLALLGLVLFTLPHVDAGGSAASTVEAAPINVEQVAGVAAKQRQEARAPLPEDTSRDMALPGSADPAGPFRSTASMPPDMQRPLPRVERHIQPPVRGPPAA